MGIINLLDSQTANLIAAGEVVERPSSAAKELLENSIDAGAKSITLEIRNGGRTLLRVSDDGCGILRDDVPKVLLRHATSKIECGDDIHGIRSLGFRGEALAAIGAVSRLEIVTKHRDEEIGTRLTADENGVIMEDVGCPDGTTVTMRDIFFNTPARQKFLKKDGTEGASCIAAAERLALSHPEISFTAVSDGERKFQTAGDGELYPAIYAVFGREFAKSLIKTEHELLGVSVKGYITAPDAVRGSRAMQTTFVNGRYVKSKTVQAALEEAFRSYIPRGRFPGCVLFVSLLPELTDVNVHPAKTEIKFASERDVFRAVYYAVKNALEATPDEKPLGEVKVAVKEKPVLPELKESEDPFITPAPKKQSDAKLKDVEFFPSEREQAAQPQATQKRSSFNAGLGEEDLYDSESRYTVSDSKQGSVPDIPSAVKAEPQQSESAPVTQADEPAQVAPVHSVQTAFSDELQQTIAGQNTVAWRMIGQAYDSYIFVETEENVLIIDKHAAHERILYEQLAKNKELHVQELFSGVPVSLGREQAAILLENADYLEEKGFKIEDFGEGTVIVRTVPATLGNLKGLNGILEEFAKILSEGNGLSFEERCDRALYTVACKAALKARVKNRPEDDENVVRMLSENPHLRYCPHGRPFIKKLPKREIEKYFDR